jgi:hypothetical protein
MQDYILDGKDSEKLEMFLGIICRELHVKTIVLVHQSGSLIAEAGDRLTPHISPVATLLAAIVSAAQAFAGMMQSSLQREIRISLEQMDCLVFGLREDVVCLLVPDPLQDSQLWDGLALQLQVRLNKVLERLFKSSAI